MVASVDVTALFIEGTQDNPDFHEVVEIIRSNTTGNVWLIGGFVFRSIVRAWYGKEGAKADFDFLVENPASTIVFPNSWEKNTNSYGNPKFVRRDGLEVDFVPLHTVRRQGLPATIESFLKGTPLTVQSIMYNVERQQIEGPIGIRALHDKIVRVNDLEEARDYALRK